jgi:hypothetical protein
MKNNIEELHKQIKDLLEKVTIVIEGNNLKPLMINENAFKALIEMKALKAHMAETYGGSDERIEHLKVQGEVLLGLQRLIKGKELFDSVVKHANGSGKPEYIDDDLLRAAVNVARSLYNTVHKRLEVVGWVID